MTGNDGESTSWGPEGGVDATYKPLGEIASLEVSKLSGRRTKDRTWDLGSFSLLAEEGNWGEFRIGFLLDKCPAIIVGAIISRSEVWGLK